MALGMDVPHVRVPARAGPGRSGHVPVSKVTTAR